MNIQDLSCQQLLADPERWRNVASRIRDDWARCFAELQNLEKLLEEDKITRIKWARRLKIFGFLLSGFQNLIAGITALLPLSKIQYPEYTIYILSGFTFVLSLSLWTQLNSRSYHCLTLAKDAQKLSLLCKNVRQILRDAISDGRITEQERSLIRDMIGQMHQRAEEIGSLSLILKLFADNDSSMSTSPKLFAPNRNNYQNAYEGMSHILEEIKNSQKEISARLPHIVKEYKDSQIQCQIHSSALPQVIVPTDDIPIIGRNKSLVVL